MVSLRLSCPSPLVFLLVSGLVKSSRGASCACEAENFGFPITCQDTDAMIQGLASLQSNDCTADCSSDICRKSYFLVQSHHDYCPEDGVPTVVEDGLHDFEGSCEDCDITRQPNPNFPSCPVVNCKVDGPGNVAYQTLLDNECLVDCSSQTCVDNFRVLVAVHDSCPEDSLSQDAEEGLHDFEDPCASMGCNVIAVDGGDDQLICKSTAENSSAALHVSNVGLATVMVALVAVVA